MRALILGVALTLGAAPLLAQQPAQSGDSARRDSVARRERALNARLFASDSVLQFTLTTNFRRLRRERRGETPMQPGAITYTAGDSTVRVPLQLRVRGIWRRQNCDFPPIRLDFARDSVKGTVFARQDQPKLVSHCRDNDTFEQYILQEFQLYRVYQQVTPYAHRARLARVTYMDSGATRPVATRYAILVEEASDVAARTNARRLQQLGANPSDVDYDESAILGLFEYLAGNTDFSISALHNIELFTDAMAVHPVAYDFDFSGMVNARYAAPDPKLDIPDVRTRLFRGYCVPPESFARAAAVFREKKDAIYALYRDPLAQLMRPDERESSIHYLDEFYRVLEDPQRFQREVVSKCLGRL